MIQPNFFLVGAPKCGTTAMNAYLAAHPDVFMCPRKEVHHFAPDLPGHRNLRFAPREAYLRLFSGVTDETAVGEASVFYLYSKLAAAEIHDFDPQAKILVMLRNPVDWVASYHSQMVFNAEEDLPLEDALLAQEERRSGEKLPKRVEEPDFLLYDEVCRFSRQIERYLDIFGSEQVMVLLLDDLKADAGRAYQSVLDFLDVDGGFRPDFAVVNANKEVISTALGRLISRPPRALSSMVRALLPWKLASRIRHSLKMRNRRARTRPELSESLRVHLAGRYRWEIERLARLLDRDLSMWMKTT